MERLRSRHATSFEEQLAENAAKAKARADALPPGPEREELLRKADIALHVNDWLSSPGLQSPK
jgi:hypothetical protein